MCTCARRNDARAGARAKIQESRSKIQKRSKIQRHGQLAAIRLGRQVANRLLTCGVRTLQELSRYLRSVDVRDTCSVLAVFVAGWPLCCFAYLSI